MTQLISRWQSLTTVIILVLSVVSSLLGLSQAGHYADPEHLLLRIYAQDAVILGIGVPVLAMGWWFGNRGSLRGYLVWLGALAFMTYIWASYAFTIAYNAFFLGYIVLFSLSLFTLVGGVLTVDVSRFSRALQGRLSHRIYGGFLGFTAVGLTALWLSELIQAAVSGTVPAAVEAFGPQAAGTYVIDLGVVVPSLAVAALWLWQQRPWGYATGGILLVFAALLAPAITAITVVDFQSGVTMSLPVIAASIVPPVIGAVFAGKYLYTIGATQIE